MMNWPEWLRVETPSGNGDCPKAVAPTARTIRIELRRMEFPTPKPEQPRSAEKPFATWHIYSFAAEGLAALLSGLEAAGFFSGVEDLLSVELVLGAGASFLAASLYFSLR